ncbi:hypothetical protein POTOM_026543 [Populus tomentosa]|uniref:Uncharacterized protein n=1 Tax=Populus tomentosa TaxID=118781 RepID=A0A8X8CXZ0_POPTO|nr:hypothetical protein POTOM_026543 [Populus tomentosa]
MSAPTRVSDGYFPKSRGDGWLEIELARNVRRRVMGSYAAEAKRGGNYPKERGDGGLEIESGEFFTREGEEEALEMRSSRQYWYLDPRVGS